MKLAKDLTTSESKLRSILTAMDSDDAEELMTAQEWDDAIQCNGVIGLTRNDLTVLIGMTANKPEYKMLAYRLAKMLVEKNQL